MFFKQPSKRQFVMILTNTNSIKVHNIDNPIKTQHGTLPSKSYKIVQLPYLEAIIPLESALNKYDKLHVIQYQCSLGVLS